MELTFIMKNRHHFETVAKCAYIDREDYRDFAENKSYSFSWMKEKKNDLMFKNTIMPDGTPEAFRNLEKLCESLEQCEANSRYDSLISRDCIFSISNDLVMRDKDGHIDKTATEEFLKPDLDQYFRENFNGYIVHYAVHMNSTELSGGEDINDNFHVHFIVFANQYDIENGTWLKKTYKDETGRFIYYSDLDDKHRSSYKIDSLRKNMASLQNHKLKELGLDANVQYQSFKKRQEDRLYTYHLSRFHYNELQELKKKYAYLNDDVAIYHAIMKERNDGATLTKKQKHNLYAEFIYNNKDIKTQSKEQAVNDALDKSFLNKSLGYKAKSTASNIKNTTLREISKGVQSTHQAEMEEMYRRGR